jgi:colanic acid biosynthesis glycosyl transferase WcaI
MSRAKVVFVNRFFYPDHSATSQLLTELCSDLAQAGCCVHVVTSRQLYDAPSAALRTYDEYAGVHIHRVWSTTFGRDRLVGRAVDYLSFYFGAGAKLVSLLRRGDVVVAKTDPPLISFVAALAAILRGAHLVNWLQDVFPEIAQRMEMKGVQGPVFWIARKIRNVCLDRAHTTVVLGERMAMEIKSQVKKPDRIRIIPNWADSARIVPVPKEANALRGEWKIGSRFVVAYSGNMGRVHEFDTVRQAVERLRHELDILFMFIGGGKQQARLMAEFEERGLTSTIRFLPYQARERLAESLSAADVHLVTLLPALEGFVVPSKFYGIAAAGRPTIFVGDVEGEIALVLRRYECGISVSAGDGFGLSEAILTLKRDAARREALGNNARKALVARFDRSHAFDEWKQLLRGFNALQQSGGS